MRDPRGHRHTLGSGGVWSKQHPLQLVTPFGVRCASDSFRRQEFAGEHVGFSNSKVSSGAHDDELGRQRCHLLGNGGVEVHVRLRGADRDDEAVAGRQVVALLSWARAPPTS